MDTQAELEKSRAWIRDVGSRPSVLAGTPTALANELGVSDKDAAALLFRLGLEGLVEPRGHVKCPACGEDIRLSSHALTELLSEIEQLPRCQSCEYDLTADVAALEVRLAFFLSEAARSNSSASEPVPPPNPNAIEERTYTMSELRELKDVFGSSSSTHISASDGANVALQGSVQTQRDGVQQAGTGNTMRDPTGKGEGGGSAWSGWAAIIAAIVLAIGGIVAALIALLK